MVVHTEHMVYRQTLLQAVLVKPQDLRETLVFLIAHTLFTAYSNSTKAKSTVTIFLSLLPAVRLRV